MGTIVGIAAIVAFIGTAPPLAIDMAVGQSRIRGILAGLASFTTIWLSMFVYYLLATPALVGPWWGYAAELVFAFIISAGFFWLITADGYNEFRPDRLRTRTKNTWSAVGRTYDSHRWDDGPTPHNSRGKASLLTVRSLVASAPGEARNILHDIPGAFLAGLLALVILLSNLFMYVFTPRTNAEAKQMASYLQLQTATEAGIPKTTPEQLPIVPIEAAQDKAEQQYGSYKIPDGFYGAGKQLSTRLSVGKGNLVFYRKHLWYVFELLFKGNHANAQMHRTSPGYILVDAVDSREPIQVKLGYKIKYATTHFGFNEVQRHIWASGYSHYLLDDIKMELDEDGMPYFVGALTKRAAKFSGSVPVKAFWMNAQTGKIHVGDLADAPVWADRILSSASVKFLVDAWGNWAKEDLAYWWPNRSKGDRFQTVGKPQIIYTDTGGLQWQILLKARNKGSSSVTHFMLLDEHELKGTLYPAPNITGADRVTEVVNDSTSSKVKATTPLLVWIFDRLTWAVPLISPEDDDKIQSGAGLALVPANAVSADNVSIEKDRDRAFLAYHRWVDRAVVQAPSSSAKQSANGKVVKVTHMTLHGETVILLQLDSKPADVRFRLFADTVGMTVEAVEVQEGDTVTLEYIDVGRQIYDVHKIDVLGVDMTEAAGT